MAVTLAVAEAWSQGGAWITADSRLTDRWGDRANDFASPELKVIILDAYLCVAYAGDQDIALSGVRALLPPFDVEAVRMALQEVHQRTGRADFIVSSFGPVSALYVIKSGRSSAVDRCWIGDHRAFDAFQEVRHSLVRPTIASGSDISEEFLALADTPRALESLVERGNARSIGELVITARPNRGGYRYLNSASLSVTRTSFAPETPYRRSAVGPRPEADV